MKYSKSLQNKIDISINYKISSQRYIVYGKNGKGKEYMDYNDALKFVRDYEIWRRIFKWKKEWKRKEYYDCKLVFDGEYKNGIKNGKAKEFFNDKITFEGEYLNRKNGM